MAARLRLFGGVVWLAIPWAERSHGTYRPAELGYSELLSPAVTTASRGRRPVIRVASRRQLLESESSYIGSSAIATGSAVVCGRLATVRRLWALLSGAASLQLLLGRLAARWVLFQRISRSGPSRHLRALHDFVVLSSGIGSVPRSAGLSWSLRSPARNAPRARSRRPGARVAGGAGGSGPWLVSNRSAHDVGGFA